LIVALVKISFSVVLDGCSFCIVAPVGVIVLSFSLFSYFSFISTFTDVVGSQFIFLSLLRRSILLAIGVS